MGAQSLDLRTLKKLCEKSRKMKSGRRGNSLKDKLNIFFIIFIIVIVVTFEQNLIPMTLFKIVTCVQNPVSSFTDWCFRQNIFLISSVIVTGNCILKIYRLRKYLTSSTVIKMHANNNNRTIFYIKNGIHDCIVFL